MPDLTVLRAIGDDPLAAADLLADLDADALAAAVAATSDEELQALLGGDDVRTAVARAMLTRLPDLTVPDRLAVLDGVVRYDLTDRRQVVEQQAVRLGAGTVTLLPEAEPAADLVLTCPLPTFLRLVTGGRNAGIELLSGSLDVDGDATLALGFGGAFRVPGTTSETVDPEHLDPVEVAAALGRVDGKHLQKVMRSGFRGVVLAEVFRRLPDFVVPEQVADLRLCVGFRLRGHPSGEMERYVVAIDRGVTTVLSGDDAEAGPPRDATVTCEGHDFLRLATGHLNPVVGVLKGRLKVRGDRAKALKLAAVIDIPQSPAGGQP